MSFFLRALIAFTTAAHVPFALGLAHLATELRFNAPWAWGLSFGAIGVLLFIGRARAAMPDHRRSHHLVRWVDVPYYVHWSACVLALFVSLPAALAWLVADLVRSGQPDFHGALFLGSYGLGVVVAAYAIGVRRRWYRVEDVELRISGLPSAFEGYRIAHLSDLHIGGLTPRAWGMRWAESANRRAPDLAVVTGDMVTSGTDYHDDIRDVIAALRARDGTVVSMGNHDYFGDGEPLVSLLRAAGVRVLRNEGEVLSRGDGQLFLSAIDDTWTRRADVDATLAARPPGTVTICLAHDPEAFPTLAERGVELVLSGHTHGGQIAMPFFARHANLAALTHKFTLGLYTVGESQLYVHPGLGTTGPPVRFGVAPAVVMYTLRTAPRP
jgi:predicted MPP superfamily phosphohydrolase